MFGTKVGNLCVRRRGSAPAAWARTVSEPLDSTPEQEARFLPAVPAVFFGLCLLWDEIRSRAIQVAQLMESR